MHRRLSAWILLFAILSASVGMLVFATLHLQFHHYRMARTSHVGYETLEVNGNEHPELMNGAREIRLNGRWFDVKTLDQQDGHVYITGHYDDEEEGLLNRVSRFSEEIGKREKVWIPVVVPPVFLETFESPAWRTPYCVELTFGDPFHNLPEPIVSPMVPPPLRLA